MFYQYISDIYQYFSKNSSPRTCEVHSRYFAEISKISYILPKYLRFYRFLADFLANRLSVGKIYRYRLISNISAMYWPIYPIFCSLGRGAKARHKFGTCSWLVLDLVSGGNWRTGKGCLFVSWLVHILPIKKGMSLSKGYID